MEVINKNQSKNHQNAVERNIEIHLHEALHNHHQSQAAAHPHDPVDLHVGVKIAAKNDKLASIVEMIIEIVQKINKDNATTNNVKDKGSKEDDHHKTMAIIVDKCHPLQNLILSRSQLAPIL